MWKIISAKLQKFNSFIQFKIKFWMHFIKNRPRKLTKICGKYGETRYAQILKLFKVVLHIHKDLHEIIR